MAKQNGAATRAGSVTNAARGGRHGFITAMAVVTAAGMPIGSAAGDTYEWWSPTAAPVTGNFSTSANWKDFVRPSTSPGAFNHLEFLFANPQNFTANNNLRDGLNVGKIDAASGTMTATITGLPLYLTPVHLNGPRCQISGPGGFGALVLKTPLFGGTGFEVVEGRVILDPSSTSSHSITGGIVVSGGELQFQYPSDTGGISNSITLNGGVLHNTGNAPLSIPLTANGGSLETDFGKYLRLWTPIQGSGIVTKTGLGTLDLVSTGSTASIDWTLDEGTMSIIGDAAGTGSVTQHQGTDLILTGDSTLSHLESMPSGSFRGALNMNGFELTLAPDAAGPVAELPELFGSGTLRIDGDRVYEIAEVGGNFSGSFSVEQGEIVVADGLDIDGIGQIETAGSGVFKIGSAAVTTGSVAGTGTVNVGDGGTLTILGSDTYDGKFSGPMGARIINEAASQTWNVSANMSAFEGDLIMRGSQLRLYSTFSGASTTVVLEQGASLSMDDSMTIGGLGGDGSVGIPSLRQLRVGGDGSVFSGGFLANVITSSVKKIGNGTWTLMNPDFTGYRGSIWVADGTLRLEGGNLTPTSTATNVISSGATLAGYGSMAASFQSAGRIVADVAGETLNIDSTIRKLGSAGDVEAENGGTIELDGARLEQDPGGRLRALDGSTVLITGAGSDIFDGRVETQGTGEIIIDHPDLDLYGPSIDGNIRFRGGAAADFTDVSWTVGDEDTVRIETAGPGGAALIRGIGDQSAIVLGGTLEIIPLDGYTPAAGDRIWLAQNLSSNSINVTGQFAAFTGVDVAPLEWRVVQTNAAVIDLVLACPVDLAAPFGLLDLADINAFVSAFVSNGSLADLDGNGLFDLTDINMFVTGFTSCE